MGDRPEHVGDALAPGDQVARDDDDAVLLPGMLRPSHPSCDVVQASPIEEPGGEGEFFP